MKIILKSINTNLEFITKNLGMVIIIGLLLFTACAKEQMPTGGPKDTIPPEIIKSIPKDLSTSFKGKKIRFTFNKHIQLNNIKKELLVSPNINKKYTTKLLKGGKVLEMTLTQPLDSNTTYTFNFQKGIQDVTEKNILKDAIFTFSTGKHLDSLIVTGNVYKLLENQPEKEAIVALYRAKDTLNIFNSTPIYFTVSDEKGDFKIENIKNDKYRIYAFKTKSNALKANLKGNLIGFLPDTIALDSNISELKIPMINKNLLELKEKKAVPSGRYFEVGYNKPIDEFKILTKDFPLAYNLLEGDQVIRFYNTSSIKPKDSVQVKIMAKDSVENQIEGTYAISFRLSKRKKSAFSEKIITNQKRYITEKFDGKIMFTKPVETINTDSIYFYYDSLNSIQINPEKDLKWNDNHTELELSKLLKLDTILTANDSIPLPEFNRVNLKLNKGAFISVENDTSIASSKEYVFVKEDKVGSIEGKVKTNSKNYTIQLINQKLTVVDEIMNVKEYKFINVEPGTYQIRILVDENNNGKWEFGNILKNIPPDPVYFYPEKISLRENWEVNDINLDF